ncbi:polysaccharide biosynthesis related protein [Iodidimonas gelatinilytica]|uniref:Polysaccharide biosynthesis related protein n=1 Tax=Iodidimonas gelatinilytica TaxID=1236966 RepID=A0A5A7MUT9_9PROT|nr:polysaccharide biosynthesis related protein [Iodidimonas gelatinilytica]
MAREDRFSGLKRWVVRQSDEHLSEVLSGAAVTFGVKIAGVGLMFLFNILVARLLGVADTGLFFLALTVLQVGATVTLWGLDKATLRYVAGFVANERWSDVRAVLSRAVILALSISVFLAVLVFFSAPFLAIRIFHEPALEVSLRIVAIALPVLAILPIFVEGLKGLKKIFASQILQGAILPVFALLGLFLLAEEYGASGAVMAYGLSALMALLLGWGLWHWQLSRRDAGGDTHFSYSQLLRSAGPLGGISVLHLLMQWVPLLALGAFGTSAEVGLFGVAVRTAALTSLLLVAVNSIAAPKFAALWAKGDYDALQKLAVKSTALITLLAAPILLCFILFPSFVLGLFGGDFKDGATALSILAAGQFVNAATGSVGFLLIMTGHERQLWKSVALAAFSSLLMSGLIMGGAGLVMAALAVAVPLALQNILSSFYVMRYLHIMPCNYSLLFR